MKLLLDENLPHALRGLLAPHDVFTIKYMNWSGLENGELLAKAAPAGFDALITKDSGIRYEQNLASLPLSLVVLTAKTNKIEDIAPLVPQLLRELNHLKAKSVLRIG